MKILIVDDEGPARSRLVTLVDAVGGHQVVGEASSGREALTLRDRSDPDVVLLDIRMPGMDGLETAARLSQQREPPAIIFVTAYGDHALQAFETAAIDYLLKPVRRDRLATALGKARRLNRAQLDALQAPEDEGCREHILCRRRSGVELIPVGSVHYFLADQKYVTVRHTEGEDLIEDSLKKLEGEFGERFVRIHRKALVARDRLVGLEKGSNGRTYAVLNEGDVRLEVSRRHLPAVRSLLRETGVA
ncbi:MAG TPA: LytTR family DNA-binding domain-containing protein [Gammaproteobacteria bacterium]|nr:LytTR family DNA-binding domain-containing protein [Gammaproteobacteria bacterium]